MQEKNSEHFLPEFKLWTSTVWKKKSTSADLCLTFEDVHTIYCSLSNWSKLRTDKWENFFQSLLRRLFWSVFLNSLDKWQTTLCEMDKELNIRTRQKRLHKIETIQRFLCRRIPCFWLGIHVFLWFRNIDACSWLITVAVLAANFAKEQWVSEGVTRKREGARRWSEFGLADAG